MTAVSDDSLAYDSRMAQTQGPGSTTIDRTTETRGGAHTHRRISWGAIIGGVVLAVAVQILLSLLGAGIGLGTVNINAGSTPSAGNLGMGAGIWWIVSSCVALFLGGFTTAWLAGVEIRLDGLLHGLVMWGIATLLTVWLLSSAVGGIIGGGFSALGGVTSAAGSGLGQAVKPMADAAGLTPDMMREQTAEYLRPEISTDPASMSPQDAQKDVAKNLVTYARGGSGASDAKQRVITVMAAQRKMSRDEAGKDFDDAQSKMTQTENQAGQTAKNAADAGASGVSKAAFAAFGVLLLELIAAAIGGSLAVQRRYSVTRSTVEGHAYNAS